MIDTRTPLERRFRRLPVALVLLAALVFAGFPLFWLASVVKSIPAQFLSALPYLATVLVLVLISRNKRLTMMNTPASLGRAFVPER